jgi:hypothetical protein
LSDIRQLQMAAEAADIKLQDKLTRQGITLRTIEGIVHGMSVQFDAAVTGGLQVGDKLAQAESERQRLHYAEDLVEYINFFAASPREMVPMAQNYEGEDLLTLLPLKLRKQGWTHIALGLFNLRRILYDISALDLHHATAMVLALSESIEKDLLHLFEALALQLLETPDDREVIISAREVVVALHFFNEGMALQKRYIFSIAQSRRPKERKQRRDGLTKKLMQGVSELGEKLRGKVQGGAKLLGVNKADAGDKGEGPGNNDNRDAAVDMTPPASEKPGKDDGSYSSDDLSGLLVSLQRLLNAQLRIIRCVFPRATAEKVTKALITRIFNDPIFNIQNTIDTLMSTAGVASSPSMYLDVLQIVREKISAFILVMLESCKAHDREMSNSAIEDALGSQSQEAGNSSAEAPRMSSPYANLVREFVSAVVGGGISLRQTPAALVVSARVPSATPGVDTAVAAPSAFMDDVKQFLGEQTSLLLSNYMTDYFQKELGYLWSQYNDAVRSSVDDTNVIVKVKLNTITDHSSGSRFKRGSQVENMIYKLRPDRFKSIAQLLQVLESGLIQRILAPSSDAALRMLNIGREDPALPERLSELFKTMLSCLAEHVLLPAAEAFQLLLVKHTSSRNFTSSPIPIDYILILSLIYDAFFRIKTSFDFTFAPAFAAHPNDLTSCREFKRAMVKRIDAAFSVSLQKWVEAVAYFCDRVLNNVQSRFDFAPKFSNDKLLGIEPTSACKEVCKTLANSIALVRKHITERPENSADKTSGKSTALRLKKIADSVWKDLGYRFVAIYLTHLRKHRVSQEGAFVLVRDLDEIYAVVSTMECIQVTDMIGSIREVVYVYMAPTENIVRMITDELRHLDTRILLTLLKSRSDFSQKSAWVKELNLIYPSLTRWNQPFPWEPDPNASSSAAGSVHLIVRRLPRTLRKVSIEKSALLLPVTKRFGGPSGPTSSLAPTAGGTTTGSLLINSAVGGLTDSSFQSENLYQRLKSADGGGTTKQQWSLSSFSLGDGVGPEAASVKAVPVVNTSQSGALSTPTPSSSSFAAASATGQTASRAAGSTASAGGGTAPSNPSGNSGSGGGFLKRFGFG